MCWRIFLCVMSVSLLVGCETQSKAPPAAAANDQPDREIPTNFTGTLQSGVVAIGGEHTGWMIAGDGAVGGVEVDVSKVREEARRLDGKRVTITGKMINRNYTERGKTAVLVADSIKAAVKPEGNKTAENGVG
jgi:hypothetical protein